MNLHEYRASNAERARTDDILRLIPTSGVNALDIGARDGHFSRLLAERFKSVTALDLQEPPFSIPNVQCVAGDVTKLQFDDNFFELVLCAEVLEHIPSEFLEIACSELARVTGSLLIIGVPYKQDIRLGRTTCTACGKKNPPWGHVNTFDEDLLKSLFRGLELRQLSYVGQNIAQTNWLSVYLMDLAGNPYGTYTQDEPCLFCGQTFMQPPHQSIFQKILAKLGFYARYCTAPFRGSRANWIHMLFQKSYM